MITKFEIESLASQASKKYLEDKIPLEEEITKIAKQHNLTPEQIRRVTETANTSTYLTLLKHAKAKDRYIEFDVAKPNNIIKMAKAVPEDKISLADYRELPNIFPMVKQAGLSKDESKEPTLTEKRIVIEKIAALKNHLKHEKLAAEFEFNKSYNHIYDVCKQAVLSDKASFEDFKPAAEESHQVKVMEKIAEDLTKNGVNINTPRCNPLVANEIKSSLTKLSQLVLAAKQIDNWVDICDRNIALVKTGGTKTIPGNIISGIGSIFKGTNELRVAGGKMAIKTIAGGVRHPALTFGVPATGLVAYQVGKGKTEKKDIPKINPNRERLGYTRYV